MTRQEGIILFFAPETDAPALVRLEAFVTHPGNGHRRQGNIIQLGPAFDPEPNTGADWIGDWRGPFGGLRRDD